MTVLFSYTRDECSQQSALTTVNCAHTVSSHRSVSGPFLPLDSGRSAAKRARADDIQVSGLPLHAGPLGAASAPEARAESCHYCGCWGRPGLSPVPRLIPPGIPGERWGHVSASRWLEEGADFPCCQGLCIDGRLLHSCLCKGQKLSANTLAGKSIAPRDPGGNGIHTPQHSIFRLCPSLSTIISAPVESAQIALDAPRVSSCPVNLTSQTPCDAHISFLPSERYTTSWLLQARESQL